MSTCRWLLTTKKNWLFLKVIVEYFETTKRIKNSDTYTNKEDKYVIIVKYNGGLFTDVDITDVKTIE